MKEKKKSKFLWIILSVIAALLVFVGICVAGAMDYNARVPKISVKETLEVTSGTTLSVSELAEITCKNPYTVRLEITDTNVTSAKVLDGDGSRQGGEDPRLYVGDEPGYIRLAISPVGSVAEQVSANVTIYVKPGDAEQKKLLEAAGAEFAEIRQFLEEGSFSKNKEYLDEELVTLYYLDLGKQLGHAEYYLQRASEDGGEKYYRILAKYVLVSKDAGPQLADAEALEIDEEAFHQAQKLSEKVVLIKES